MKNIDFNQHSRNGLLSTDLTTNRTSLSSSPEPDFITTYDLYGNACSYYKDPVWDFSAYSPKKQKLNFTSWVKKGCESSITRKISEEMRYIMYVVLFLSGKITSPATAISILTCLRTLAKQLSKANITIFDIFTNEDVLNPLVKILHKVTNGKNAVILYSLINIIYEVKKYKSISIDILPKSTFEPVRALAEKYNNRDKKQTPPFPSQIYLNLLKRLHEFILSFDSIKEDYLNAVSAASLSIADGLAVDTQRKRHKKHRALQWDKKLSKKYSCYKHVKEPSFEDLLTPKLKEYCNNHNITNPRALCNHINIVYRVGKLLIHAYTGMRDKEVDSMNYDCLGEITYARKKSPVIYSQTTKFNHGVPKNVEWITNSVGKHAVQTMQYIAKEIYFILEGGYFDISNQPLFISTLYLPLTSQKIRDFRFEKYQPSRYHMNISSYFADVLYIKKEDIDELKLIDPYRAWENEIEFQVGEIFNVTTHRFRRSLVLYAQRSGLVSLPTLRRQLKQITEAMTSYYGSGNANAKKLVAMNNEHVANEYLNAIPESAGISYIINVLLSDEVLFGGHGTWVNRRQSDLSNTDRQETMKNFKSGKIAYKETQFGGCTTTTPCNKKPMRSTNACLECKDSVIKLSKLNKVIKIQSNILASLDKQGQNYIYEKTELEILLSKRESIQNKKVINNDV